MKKELQGPRMFSALLVMLMLALALVMPVPALAQPHIDVDGNLEDFTGAGVVIIDDPLGDVYLPGNAPPGTISGWDMKELRLFYDAANDIMYVGINVGLDASTILGDADSDGNPGEASAWLGTNLGVDLPNLEGQETAAVYFDLDLNDKWDVIAGISATGNHSGFSVNAVKQPFISPGFCFGDLLDYHNGGISPSPNSAHPDLEFAIIHWTELPGQDSSPDFRVGAFLGAYTQDDGIGEDSLVYDYRVAPPVGGTAFPVDKLGLLAPWAVLLGGAGIVTFLMLRKRRPA